MPKLLYFTMSERLIHAKDDTISLITMFNGLDVGSSTELPAGKFLAEPKWIPMEWVLFATWQREEEDTGKTFEQRFSIHFPNSKKLVLSRVEFTLSASVHRSYITNRFFPLVGAGVYECRTAIRELASDKRWIHAATLPLNVRITVGEFPG